MTMTRKQERSSGAVAWGCCVLILSIWTVGRAELSVRIAPGSGGDVDLSWTVVSNHSYGVQSCSNLLTPDWRAAGSVDQWPVDVTNWTAAATAVGGQFYRLRAAERGKLVSWSKIDDFAAWEINLVLFTMGLSATAQNPVDVYRLTYLTYDHRDQSALASGAFVVPVGPSSAPLLSYQHGTVFLTNDVPSTVGNSEQFLGVVLASEGYLVAMPDFLGLGYASPPLHPYVHVRSTAVTCVDMLRACRTFVADELLLTLESDLFLAGYSQGGQATLALQRELQRHHASEFTVTAAAPMAGPYDLSGTMAAPIAQSLPYPEPAYVAYILMGYQSVYRFWEDPAEVLASPYDQSLPPLFDGGHSSSEINAVMPAVPSNIFRPEFLTDFNSDTNNGLRAAMRANDLYDWAPSAPTRLYHCAGDTVVPIANSYVAYSNFVANGATNVSLVDPAPTADHADGAQPCFLSARAWFNGLRATTAP